MSAETFALKPSELCPYFVGGIFIPDGFGKAELEFAVMTIVKFCAEEGDKWQGVSWPQIAAYLKARDELPEWKWLHNPFMTPDFRGLFTKGLATSPDDGDQIFLTPKTIARCVEVLKVPNS